MRHIGELIILNSSAVLSISLLYIIVVVAPNVLVVKDSYYFANHSAVASNNNNSTVNILYNENATTAVEGSKEKIIFGFLFGMRGMVQIFASPLCGYIIDKTYPLVVILIGLSVDLLACCIYAFSSSFAPYFIARCLNSFGASVNACGAYSGVSYYFKDDRVRRKLSGILHVIEFIGVSSAPPLGGAVFQLLGPAPVYLLLTPIYTALIIWVSVCVARHKQKEDDYDGVSTCSRYELEVLSGDNDGQINENNRLARSTPNRRTNNKEKTIVFASLLRLLCDPFVMIIAWGIALSMMGSIALNVTLPLYMRRKFQSAMYEQGLVFLPGVAFHILGTLSMATICHYCSRYSHFFLLAIFSINGGIMFSLLYMEVWYWLIVPAGFNLFTIAFVEYACYPFLATLVEARHSSNYGSVTSIALCSFGIVSCLVSFLSGPLVEYFGFYWFIAGISAVYLLYAPMFLVTAKYWK